jgi:hypothetical protein
MKARKGLIPSGHPRDIEEIENIGEPQISSAGISPRKAETPCGATTSPTYRQGRADSS